MANHKGYVIIAQNTTTRSFKMKLDREVGQKERESQHKSQTRTQAQQEAISRVSQTYTAISRAHKVPADTAKTLTKS